MYIYNKKKIYIYIDDVIILDFGSPHFVNYSDAKMEPWFQKKKRSSPLFRRFKKDGFNRYLYT